jgi:Flp pilus assembly protein TadG
MKKKHASQTKTKLSRWLGSRDEGSSMVEFAIMLPVLLILFAGGAELGRLFYTYTTLVKATEVGARYLSTSRDATSPVVADANAAKLRAQSLAVCGYTSCTGQTPVVPGLSPATNIAVTFPVRNNIKYVKVQIQAYNYAPGVFNLANFTGLANTVFYFGLTPATEMRYMQ